MQESLTQVRVAELDAAVLQTAVALGLTLVALTLHRRYRRPWFGWFAAAFALYVLRLLSIVAFVTTDARIWLYWHQVATGWTALALLWAALRFSRPLVFRPAYALWLLFPVGWSAVAIYGLDVFLFAALPAVLFLSLVTAWTGWVFLMHGRRVNAKGARFLGIAFVVWALHHLDYPFLRARGAWVPWGYYLDIVFLLLIGTGLLLLVLDDLHGGIATLTALVQPGMHGELPGMSELLWRAAALPTATGAALFSSEGAILGRTGDCAAWTDAPGEALQVVGAVTAGSVPVVREGGTPRGAAGYLAGLPIPRRAGAAEVLLVSGVGRQPFTALDDAYLAALGRQIGALRDGAEMTQRLRARTDELGRLSVRMVQQHEEERHRLSLELHDETAQVISSVKLRLGMLRERASGDNLASIDDVLRLVDHGMRSIRDVTWMLRPAVLDDLGLPAALRSLARDFEENSGIAVTLETPDQVTGLPEGAELVLYRGMQEGLANIARHADASHVRVHLDDSERAVVLRLTDDGQRLQSPPDIDGLQRGGHLGLAGLRERAQSLGGRLSLRLTEHGGLELEVLVPRVKTP